MTEGYELNFTERYVKKLKRREKVGLIGSVICLSLMVIIVLIVVLATEATREYKILVWLGLIVSFMWSIAFSTLRPDSTVLADWESALDRLRNGGNL